MITLQCSSEFADAFSSRMGGCSFQCRCGTTWWDDFNNGIDWEEGEFERLSLLSVTEPQKYKRAGGAVSWMTIDGKDIVWGCTCTIAQQYERFLEQHAAQIADYLRLRRARLLREAEKLAGELSL
jgi:hypothetical protein